MITKKDFKKITPFIWEIPKTFRVDMRVPARILASENLLDDLFKDSSLEQLINVATLPGIQKAAYCMPDAHEGYGFPIGAVAATIYPNGVISPGGIGYDINCGVRLLKSNLEFSDINHNQGLLAKRLYEEIPSGVGRGGRLKLEDKKLDQVLSQGAQFLINEGYGEAKDAHFLESFGKLSNADPNLVSKHAKDRGRDQLGTMGAGNHFVEVDQIEEIFDNEVASKLGLFKNQIVILIHTGSRGLGHQIATDYIRVMQSSLHKYNITLLDRELACAPFSSEEGTNYFNAMASAANFAWANRQLISWGIRLVFKEMFNEDLNILYDVAHNIAKIEEHEIEGQVKKVIVHRKGATRSFGPNHPEVIDEYKETGQPVIIPGSMGSSSYILVGTIEGMKEAFGSSCHGAGRRMSRHAALREVQGKKLKIDLETQGIFIQTGSIKGLAEEAPLAYKDIHEVIDIVNNAQIAKKVARLKPIVVIKG
ncbi:RtcB family protein [Candidatus Daviesbacteria bacterium]|nr:RtcB family protein [Candidatus Daviesbacteria bacterium]